MVVIIKPMSREDKIAGYMELTKLQLAEMLANANEALDREFKRTGPHPGYLAQVLGDPRDCVEMKCDPPFLGGVGPHPIALSDE